jgi:hypothetical protein
MKTMQCPNCGRKVEKIDQMFCGTCGTPVKPRRETLPEPKPVMEDQPRKKLAKDDLQPIAKEVQQPITVDILQPMTKVDLRPSTTDILQPVYEVEGELNRLTLGFDKNILMPINEISNLSDSLYRWRTSFNTRIDILTGFIRSASLDSPKYENLNQLKDLKYQIGKMEGDLDDFKRQWYKILGKIENYEPESFLDSFETEVTKIRDTLPDLNERIKIVKNLDFEPLEQQVHSFLAEIDERITTLTTMVPVPVPAKKVRPERIRLKTAGTSEVAVGSQVTERQQEPSIRFTSLISEKIVSNLYGFIGAAFLMIAFFSLVIYSYTIVIPYFGPNATPENALLFVFAFYAGAFSLLLFSLLILPRGVKRFPWITHFIGPASSSAFILMVLTSIIQVLYFENLNWPGEYIFLGLLILAISFASTIVAYLASRQSLAITGISLGMMVSYLVAISPTLDTAFVPNYDNLFGVVSMEFGIISFVLYVSFLLLASLFVIKRQYWLPFTGYGLFSPVLWFLGSNNIAFPEILLLSFAIATVALVVKKRMPTPRAFSHFLATLFLIYPNLVVILIIQQSSQKYSSHFGNILILVLILVLGAFFVLYWIFVLLEQDLQVSFINPLSPKFKEEKVDLRQAQNLNWLFFSSILFVFLAWFSLRPHQMVMDVPLIVFPILLIGTAIVGWRTELEKQVSSSIFLIFISGEILFVLTCLLGAPNLRVNSLDLEFWAVPDFLFFGLFLVIFSSIFEIVNRKPMTIHFYQAIIKHKWIIVGIALLSIFNTLLIINTSSGAFLLLLAVITWGAMSVFGIFWRDYSIKQINFRHLAPVTGMITLILGAIIRDNWLIISTNIVTILLHHLFLNLSLVTFPIIALVAVYQGSKFKSNDTKFSSTPSSQLPSSLNHYVNEGTYHLSQIIIFLLPSLYMVFIDPYFVKELEYQILFCFYVILFLVLLPMFYMLSKRRKNQSFGALASLTGYYAFFIGFVLFGPIISVKNLIFQLFLGQSGTESIVIGENNGIPLQWVILGFIAVLAISIFITAIITYQPVSVDKSEKMVDEDRSEKEEPSETKLSKNELKGDNDQ